MKDKALMISVYTNGGAFPAVRLEGYAFRSAVLCPQPPGGAQHQVKYESGNSFFLDKWDFFFERIDS